MRALALAATAVLAGCGVSAQGGGLVDGRMELPKQLREVSGLVVVDERTVACVQDEKGVIWLVDLRGERPLREEDFGPRGDHEGLARVGDQWWVLRSDGVLLQLARKDDSLRIEREIALPGGHKDWESLCHDEAGKRLLALPKQVAGDDKEARDRRPIHAVDPATGEIAAEPVLVLSRRSVEEALLARGVALPTKTTDKGRSKVEFDLAVSEIAVVPGRRELLLLAGKDRVLVRVDFAGAVLGGCRFDEKLLPQAEGLAFLPDGRLLVASEGDGKKARLVVVPMP